MGKSLVIVESPAKAKTISKKENKRIISRRKSLKIIWIVTNKKGSSFFIYQKNLIFQTNILCHNIIKHRS